MFVLHVQSVDFPQPIATTFTAAHGLNPKNNKIKKTNLNPSELRGIAHLFRLLTPSNSSGYPVPITIANPSARSTQVFIVAVPSYVSADDFLLFCGTHVNYFTDVLFLRNDAMEDRYSVLISLADRASSDGFYCVYNGKRFKPAETEVCHIYFIQRVEYTDLAEIASNPPQGYTELPTCPVCLERLDYDTSGIRNTLCDHSFQCSCVSKWTYLSCQVCRLCQQQDEKPTCAVCGTLKNLWVCLICGFVGCGRYEEGHAIRHWSDTEHHFSLELETQQIWDYVGDKYVHRLNPKADGKSVMVNSRCSSIDGGECGTCGYDEDPELGGALLDSKVEAIMDEYNHLLASQLEVQRQHYESLLAEARSGKESSISRSVDKVIFSMVHERQSKLELYAEKKKAVAKINTELMLQQDLMQKKIKEIEAREKLALKMKDEKIIDLEEQIRDLKVYVEAQKTIAKMTDTDGIKGGTVLPVESNNSSSRNPKRRTKSGRRRN